MVKIIVCRKGKLADNESLKISNNFAFLLDELDPNVLRPLLYQKKIINHEEMENLKSESLKRRNGNECLLKYVMESGKGGLDKFVECLVEGGFTEAVSRLKEKTEEIRAVLVGKTGVGKSALGNSLLGEEVFLSKRANSSVTLTCSDVEEGNMTLGGKKTAFKLLDTPGFFDTRGDKINLGLEIANCVIKTAPGPHVFIYVISLMQRFTEEDGKAIDDLKQIFGEKVMEHLVVVFTGKDGLDDDETVEDWLNDAPPMLTDILDNGYVAFSNKKCDKGSIGKITQMIDKNVQKNEGKYYSNAMYKEAVKVFEKATREAEEISRKRDELEQENRNLHNELTKTNEELEKLTAAYNKIQNLETQVTVQDQEISKLKEMADIDNNDKGHIKCKQCEHSIAKSSNITEKNGDPPLQSSCVSKFGKMVKTKQYRCPGGYKFDIFTSTRADVVEDESMKRTIEHTWFPGYDWTIVRCPGGDCRKHLGWLFQKDQEKPFYGMIIDRLTD